MNSMSSADSGTVSSISIGGIGLVIFMCVCYMYLIVC